MFQTDQSTAVSSLPTPATAGTQGFFTGGNPGSGLPATIVDADFLNMIQQELINVVEAGGETPSKTTYNQVLLAIKALIAQPQTNLVSGVVGSVRNLFMQVTAASASTSLTADEIIVESALGGLRYCLASFNKTLNLGTTGAGGMDTGTAPASGFVAIYTIFNPTTGVSALLATNATAAAVFNVYSGANMPAGYTASALVSVWPTTSGSLLGVGVQRDRRVTVPAVTVLAVASGTITLTTLSIAAAVPKNAFEIDIYIGLTMNTAGSGIAFNVVGSQQLTDLLTAEAGSSSGTLTSINIKARMMLAAAQTIYYSMQNTNSGSYSIAITGYSF